jgi:hypothetical protein
MHFSHHLIAATALFSFASAHILVASDGPDFDSLGLSARSDIDWTNIERENAGLGSSPIFQGSEPEAFLEAVQGLDKNESTPNLQDRSAELYGRQQCQTGYGYCSGKHLASIKFVTSDRIN